MTEFVHLAGNKYAVHLYRNMIKSARRLPQPKRDDAMKSIREGFRLNAGVADAERVRVRQRGTSHCISCRVELLQPLTCGIMSLDFLGY